MAPEKNLLMTCPACGVEAQIMPLKTQNEEGGKGKVQTQAGRYELPNSQGGSGRRMEKASTGPLKRSACTKFRPGGWAIILSGPPVRVTQLSAPALPNRGWGRTPREFSPNFRPALRATVRAGHQTAAAKEADVGRKIDLILKLSVVASVLLASSSAGYYYLVYLPRRDEPQRVLEKFRAAAEKRAEQEQLLFEQRALERRAAEQRAAEERQALEKANRYQACLARATDSHNASRLAACNRPREKIVKDRDDCIKLGFAEKVCAMAHVVREASPNCALPRAVALSLDADVEKARDRCLEEDKDGSTAIALLSSTQIRTAGLGTVIVEPAEPAPIPPPPLEARAPSPKTAAVPAAIGAGAALTVPIPMAAVLPKAPASTSKPAALPSSRSRAGRAACTRSRRARGETLRCRGTRAHPCRLDRSDRRLRHRA